MNPILERLASRARTSLIVALAPALAAESRPALAASSRATTPSMYIESCNLGCSSGGGGTQVLCSSVAIPQNAEIRVRFTHPIDPSTLNDVTFSIVDVGSGQSPAGTRFVDASDPNLAVFRPDLTFDAAGNPVFGFDANTTYRIRIPGASQGDPPPYVVSLDLPHLPNRSRMLCTIQTTPAIDSPGTAFCSGDGQDPVVTTPCPCSNVGASGHGCANSSGGSGGAWLLAQGATSPDGVVLYATYEIAGTSTLFLQGSQSVAAGLPFGDGIRCTGGDLLRLAMKTASSVTATYPEPGDPSITARSAALGRPIAPGDTRYYQAWYRDADPSFCPSPMGDLWNVTNGVRITW